MNEFYTDYSEYIGRIFPNKKIQKISVNLGCTCPNRDGTLGLGGCIYCNNNSFTPEYCFKEDSIYRQIEAGKKFFGRKYKDMNYLVYFQSFTNTYNQPAKELERIYRGVLDIDDVVGIIIGTRPDCIDNDIIKMLSLINKKHPVFVEIGVETMHDETLQLINRHHDSAVSEQCIKELNKSGLHVGVHLIAGLPGENREMMMETIKRVCQTGVESIKLHHLQILKGTHLHKMVSEGKIHVKAWNLDEYVDFCKEIIDVVPREIAIERFLASSPPEMVISPKWGLKNFEFNNLLLNKLRKNNKG